MVQPDSLEAAFRARFRKASCLARCAAVLCSQQQASVSGCAVSISDVWHQEHLMLLHDCVAACSVLDLFILASAVLVPTWNCSSSILL